MVLRAPDDPGRVGGGGRRSVPAGVALRSRCFWLLSGAFFLVTLTRIA